jgi:Cu/Ag efflux protein CusF
MFRMKLFLIMFVTALALACQSPANKDGVATANEMKVERFPFKGKVVEITDKDKKKVKINHEKIEGRMDAMTMVFTVKDDAHFDQLAVGDEVKASYVFNPNDSRAWLENLEVTKK